MMRVQKEIGSLIRAFLRYGAPVRRARRPSSTADGGRVTPAASGGVDRRGLESRPRTWGLLGLAAAGVLATMVLVAPAPVAGAERARTAIVIDREDIALSGAATRRRGRADERWRLRRTCGAGRRVARRSGERAVRESPQALHRLPEQLPRFSRFQDAELTLASLPPSPLCGGPGDGAPWSAFCGGRNLRVAESRNSATCCARALGVGW